MRLVLILFAFLILVTLGGCASQPYDNSWILQQGG